MYVHKVRPVVLWNTLNYLKKSVAYYMGYRDSGEEKEVF